jgi:hypothetical protein
LLDYASLVRRLPLILAQRFELDPVIAGINYFNLSNSINFHSRALPLTLQMGPSLGAGQLPARFFEWHHLAAPASIHRGRNRRADHAESKGTMG